MHHTNRYRWLVGLGVLCAAAVTKADEGNMKKPQVCERTGVRVNFATSSSDVNNPGKASLDDVAKWMAADSQRRVRVDGYTDPTGSESFNQVLSEKRAQSVKDYLVSQGAAADRIETFGHGENVETKDFATARVAALSECAPIGQLGTPPEGQPEATQPPAEQPSPVIVVTPPPTEQPPTAVVPEQPAHEGPMSRIGMQALLGGGATSYWDKGTRAITNVGGSWDARLAIGTHSYLGGEVAYIGSAQNLTALGLQDNAILLGNGAEGTLRVNMTKSKIQPYVFGGVGWLNYQVTNTNITNAAINDHDNVLEVPFGLGLAVRPYKSFLLDVRGTGRVTYFDTLFSNFQTQTGLNGTGLNSWTGAAHLGWEF